MLHIPDKQISFAKTVSEIKHLKYSIAAPHYHLECLDLLLFFAAGSLLDSFFVYRFVNGELCNKAKIHLESKQTLLDTSERKARAGLRARLRVRNVGLTERSSGLSPLICSGRMNSDIKDLLVGASLPVEQREFLSQILTLQKRNSH